MAAGLCREAVVGSPLPGGWNRPTGGFPAGRTERAVAFGGDASMRPAELIPEKRPLTRDLLVGAEAPG